MGQGLEEEEEMKRRKEEEEERKQGGNVCFSREGRERDRLVRNARKK